ncbi:hypothetical protein CL689_02805 [Candidatus Saccharibacteria bacterium]|nr:hypothetical protein [Candidatus Saccharibacteria bacterium]|tara:strand:+ start:1708 stop:2379 length:672 start_codon:yes stop_codon:yes gene_type:complete
MLRKGCDPKLIFDRKGNMLGFSTGADACAEHEGGTNAMQIALCPEFKTQNQLVTEFRSAIESGLIAKPEDFEFKSIAERKSIRNVEEIEFHEYKEGDSECAAIIYGAAPNWAIRELGPFSGLIGEQECLGGWDESSFAIAVSGPKNIRKLKALFNSMKAGNCLFGGTFFDDSKAYHAGVIVVDGSLFRPEHRSAIAKEDQRIKAKALKTYDTEKYLAGEVAKS